MIRCGILRQSIGPNLLLHSVIVSFFFFFFFYTPVQPTNDDSSDKLRLLPHFYSMQEQAVSWKISTYVHVTNTYSNHYQPQHCENTLEHCYDACNQHTYP